MIPSLNDFGRLTQNGRRDAQGQGSCSLEIDHQGKSGGLLVGAGPDLMPSVESLASPGGALVLERRLAKPGAEQRHQGGGLAEAMAPLIGA